MPFEYNKRRNYCCAQVVDNEEPKDRSLRVADLACQSTRHIEDPEFDAMLTQCEIIAPKSRCCKEGTCIL